LHNLKEMENKQFMQYKEEEEEEEYWSHPEVSTGPILR
jgi:hypothetical protein